MQYIKRLTAALLAAVMILGLAACGTGSSAALTRPEEYAALQEHAAQADRVGPISPVPEPDGALSAPVEIPTEPEHEIRPLTAPVDNTDRDSLEQMAQLVTGEDAEVYEDLSDDELTDLIAEELRQEDQTAAPEPEQPADDPVANPVENQDSYDENGAMTQPFDQIYPELLESNQVAFDDETLLVKLPASMDGTVTDAMAAAGVGELEMLFQVENAAWYEARLILGTDVTAAVEALRAIDSILLVDYNYQVHTAAIGNYEELPENMTGNTRVGEQWYLNDCGIPSGLNVMTTPGGSSSVIVAVIDTGVDYDHEDLAGNIWVNADEVPGDGMDNDGNGYIDDYYGVNIVAGSGSGDDDNGHGTHVAGIIAAQNNNLGTVGIAYNVKIMPIKAAMASGYLNQSDIAAAIIYAHENGAQVINMSFGGTACSIAVQDALGMAYSSSVLVASAGNNGAPNQGLGAIPNYPAALSYVLGVMSVGSTGVESSFTNYDIFPFNGVEYELYAPGEGILSTIPGDRYASWSGTSMSAPVVAGMAALLRSEYPDPELYPTKFIYGQLTATSSNSAVCLDPVTHGPHNLPQVVNLHAALTTVPHPEVGLSEHYLFDTEGFELDEAGVNNGDGVIDAGETIALGLTLRNRWGKADNAVVSLTTTNENGMSDPYITIHNPELNYGSVGTYSDTDAGRVYTGDLLTGWENPFYITVAADCPNDYIFRLNVTITCENGLDTEDTAAYVTSGEILLTVRSGCVLPSIISEDMTWTSDNLYIIPNATVIPAGVTVNVEPGTRIQFWSDDPSDPYADSYMAYLRVDGTLNINGTKEEPVQIYPSDLMYGYAVALYANDGTVNMTWAEVTNLITYFNQSNIGYVIGSITSADHCTFLMDNPCDYIHYRGLYNGVVKDSSSPAGQMPTFGQVTNCVFYKLALPSYLRLKGTFDRCIFADCGLEYDNITAENCVFLGNNTVNRAVSEDGINGTWEYDAPYTYFSPNLAFKLSVADLNLTYIYDDSTTTVTSRGSSDSHLLTMQYMKEFGYDVLTIDSEETLEIFVNRLLPDLILAGYMDSTATPAVGDTYDRIYVLPGTDWDLEALETRLTERHAEVVDTINIKFHHNVILNRISTDFDVTHWLRLEAFNTSIGTGARTPMGMNYWGTTDETAIGLQILDYSDFPTAYGTWLDFNPYLTEAPENTFPFVTDVTILNEDGEEITTAANELITVRVTFNRDMDTSIPLSVQYGSSYPYRDYAVEGEFVDARTWEGTKLLTTVIENGFQYFVISNGCSAEGDLTLCTDEARFFFELDTAAAQALIMQGNPTAEGIELSWSQDDFETLMGYNVYRSDSEDGYYQRLNDTVIPAETKEFFDDTVEPGQVYYYNFTVVQTDLSESAPSGKITIQALDTMAPNIYHTPVYSAKTGANLVVTATVTDNLNVTGVTMYYRVTGEDTWHTAMMNGLNSKYTAIIPAMYVTTAGLDYYIEATDGVSTTARGSAAAPYHITVTEAQDVSSLGDVNGDGKISTLDALMLLMAINDQLNLSEAEFERADLNGDGELTASEALRILQYVSGAIGSLNA